MSYLTANTNILDKIFPLMKCMTIFSQFLLIIWGNTIDKYQILIMLILTWDSADNHLRDKAVEVGVGGSFNVKGAPANIIDGLIVQKHSHISVFQEGVGREDTVVGLNNRCGDLWRRVYCETQLWFLPIVNRQTLQEKGAKPRTSASTNSIKN
jgi:hypothetical protein